MKIKLKKELLEFNKSFHEKVIEYEVDPSEYNLNIKQKTHKLYIAKLEEYDLYFTKLMNETSCLKTIFELFNEQGDTMVQIADVSIDFRIMMKQIEQNKTFKAE
jgi:hypothetical protein